MLPERAYSDIKVPEEFITILSKTGIGKSIDDKVRISLAIALFVEKTVTLERASELAGKPISNFIQLLRSKNIPWMDYTDEHMDEDDYAIKKYFDKLEETDE